MTSASRKAAQKRYHIKNPGLRAKWQREWLARNPEKRRLYNERRRPKQIDQRLKRRYGIALDDYLCMKAAQNNLCLICEREVKLVVDHDKETGQTGGLLCNKCNLGIGYFNHDPNILVKANFYLEVYRGKNSQAA